MILCIRTRSYGFIHVGVWLEADTQVFMDRRDMCDKRISISQNAMAQLK